MPSGPQAFYADGAKRFGSLCNFVYFLFYFLHLVNIYYLEVSFVHKQSSLKFERAGSDNVIRAGEDYKNVIRTR